MKDNFSNNFMKTSDVAALFRQKKKSDWSKNCKFMVRSSEQLKPLKKS